MLSAPNRTGASYHPRVGDQPRVRGVGSIKRLGRTPRHRFVHASRGRRALRPSRAARIPARRATNVEVHHDERHLRAVVHVSLVLKRARFFLYW